MRRMQAVGIIHRDINPENLLLAKLDEWIGVNVIGKRNSNLHVANIQTNETIYRSIQAAHNKQ